MMECYQQCVNICKTCTQLSNRGSCADCGKISRSQFLSNLGHSCKCSSAGACCQDGTSDTTRLTDRGNSSQPPPQKADPAATEPSSEPPSAPATPAPKAPKNTASKQEKQTFWQWILSWFGFGAKKDRSSHEHREDYNDKSPPASRPSKFIDAESAKAILSEVKDICDEIKNRKVDSQTPTEQPPDIEPTSPKEDEKDKTASEPGVAVKKRAKGKGKSSPTSKSPSAYLGKPIQSVSFNKKSPRASSLKRNKSPTGKPEKGDKASASGEPLSEEKAASEPKRPPTSPIYSSEKYLKPYSSNLCPSDSACLTCSCTSNKQGCAQGSRTPQGEGNKKTDIEAGASCTMPIGFCCPKPCPPTCCPKPCPPTCCPNPCPPVCCPASCPPPPCCKKPPKSCSACCCSDELKRDMKKRRTSPSCGGGAPSGGCGSSSMRQSKRKRSSSCPSSPCRTPCPVCPGPCPCPPNPACPCRPMPTPCCCPPPSSCGSRSPSCKFRPPVSHKPRVPSQDCCPPKPSNLPSRCLATPTCPITCMKPCCLPSVFTVSAGSCCSPVRNNVCTYGSCSSSSYSKSKDSDAFCKYLMAKYNIAAPDPVPFCSKPRATCPPCDFKSKVHIRPLAKERPMGCPGCSPTGCYNNNKPHNWSKGFVCDSLENLTYYTRESNFQNASAEPRPKTNEQTPSTSRYNQGRHQTDFHTPKRTAVECIKQTGPRSPCGEYMSTVHFSRETKRDKMAKELLAASHLEKAGPSTESVSPKQSSSKSKTKKGSSSARRRGASNEKGSKARMSQDLSQNRILLDNMSETSVSPTNPLSYRINRGTKASRRSSHSSVISATDVARKTVRPTANRSPSKPVAERSSSMITNKRRSVSPFSRRYQPTFLSVSPVFQAKKSPVMAKTGQRQMNSMGYSRSIIDMPPMLQSYSSLLLHNWPARRAYVSPTFGQNPVTNCVQKYDQPEDESTPTPTSRLLTKDFSVYASSQHKTPENLLCTRVANVRNFDGVTGRYDYASATTSTASIIANNFITPTITTANNFTTTTTTPVVAASVACQLPTRPAFYLSPTSVRDFESDTILPKVESIPSLIEKYDKIENSASGVLTQSKCNCFDYISAVNSTTSIASACALKEDPLLPIVEEETLLSKKEEEEKVEEKEEVKEEEEEEEAEEESEDQAIQEIAASSSPPESVEEIECEEMNKGASKLEQHTHGDNNEHRKDNLIVVAPSKASDDVAAAAAAAKTKTAESHGDNFGFSLKQLNINTLVKSVCLEGTKHDTVLAGESSVDPIEFGIIGESAVDPVGKCNKSQQVAAPVQREMNQSNNQPGDFVDPKVDAVAPSTEGEGEAVAATAVAAASADKDKKDVDITTATPAVATTMLQKAAGESNTEGGEISTLEELLGGSGVMWTKVTEATEADIRVLRVSKAAHAKKMQAAPATRASDEQGMPRASQSSPNNRIPETESKPYLSLLKPGEVESSEVCDEVDDAPCGTSVDCVANYGTPV